MQPWAFRARFRRSCVRLEVVPGSRSSASRKPSPKSVRSPDKIRPQRPRAPSCSWRNFRLALTQIDGSTGALGNATYAAVQELVPLIGGAPVDTAVRKKWLDRLFEAIQADDPPYVGVTWATTGAISARHPNSHRSWADQLLPTLRSVLQRTPSRHLRLLHRHHPRATARLFKAGRHDELLELLADGSHARSGNTWSGAPACSSNAWPGRRGHRLRARSIRAAPPARKPWRVSPRTRC